MYNYLQRQLCLFLLGAFICCKPFTQALHPGDTLPSDLFITVNGLINPGTASANLQISSTCPELVSGSPSQLIILDFWATWCTACLKGFDKLKALQQQEPRLQVLLINAASTGDTEAKIKAFTTKRFPAGLPFPSVVNDTLFKQYFPYELLPHYVWLHKGRVLAITGAEELTAANIQEVLSNATTSIQQKTDINPSLPLFSDPALPPDSTQHYAVFRRGLFPGLGSGNHLRRHGSLVQGHAITNKPLGYLYRIIAASLIPGFNDKRWRISPNDSALLFNKAINGKETLCTIDYILPPSQADSLYPFMLDFLNKASGWQGQVISRVQSVYTLEATGSFTSVGVAKGPVINKLHDAASPRLQNGSIRHLLDWLNKQTWITLPVISSLPQAQTITLHWPPGITSVPALNNALKPYGLRLVQQQQPITLFQLTAPNLNHH